MALHNRDNDYADFCGLWRITDAGSNTEIWSGIAEVDDQFVIMRNGDRFRLIPSKGFKGQLGPMDLRPQVNAIAMFHDQESLGGGLVGEHDGLTIVLTIFPRKGGLEIWFGEVESAAADFKAASLRMAHGGPHGIDN